ncbi:hypothetical protein D5125_17030 [Magnetovirga frankeli]|uniref:hypothetical protein n=1 Tax=Magnetovirga frankeli TaxID=947516 RepID=UPI001293B39E|nr:hypothetical protein D5125_17030 [gamma proteobacterium SS-5]
MYYPNPVETALELLPLIDLEDSELAAVLHDQILLLSGRSPEHDPWPLSGEALSPNLCI